MARRYTAPGSPAARQARQPGDPAVVPVGQPVLAAGRRSAAHRRRCAMYLDGPCDALLFDRAPSIELVRSSEEGRHMASWPLEQQGSVGENVRTVQYLLNAHGSSLSVDGDFGPLTKAQVEQFQGNHGLSVDGIVGPQTWPALLITVSSGSNGPAVRAVQSQVDSRVDILAIDGDFGPQTDAVVRSFQAATGLAVDGIVGPHTWNAFVNGFLTASGSHNAAQLVFQAWTESNRPFAAKNATPAAVAQLFAQSWTASTWTFAGCSGAAGSVYCSWNKSGGGQLVLRVNNNVGAPFFYVTSATFS
jgi:peptidoglycan hydrolase-like protein with peptidoglycan-binding domain